MKQIFKVLPFVLILLLCLTGCSQKKQMDQTADYLEFVSGHVETINQTINDLQQQLSGFTKDSFDDENFNTKVGQTLDTLETTCNSILNKTDIPQGYEKIDESFKKLANDLNASVQTYREALNTKGYTTLQHAGDQLKGVNAAVDSFATELQNKTNEEQ